MNNQDLRRIANQVRKGLITAVYHAKAGHPGGSLSAADLITFLYFEEMNIDPERPDMPGRDRFVLSKGHCCPAQYAAMAERGYFPVEELTTLRHRGARLQGHPCMQFLPGIDMSTGSLGQGVSAACGMALAAQIDAKAAGTDPAYRVYSLLGDGELEEGEVWEAAMFASAKHLDNLCLIVDNNNLQIDGEIGKVNSPYPIDRKYEAFGFHVITIDGHDFDQIRAAFREARETKGVPTVIIMTTLKGKGVSYMENAVGWHGKAPNTAEYEQAMADLTAIDKELEGGN